MPMRAIVIREFGPPEVLRLEDAAEPEGDAIVAVEFASITFVETQIRAGRPPVAAMAPALPAVLGNGVGGRLDGVPVVSTTGGTGGYAERAAAAEPIEVPPGVSLADATALLADGRTAVGLIEGAGIRPGETVLVLAAAGGVGGLLVQLALLAGARVIGAASKPAAVRHAEPVDYTRAGWADGLGADVVFDGVGGAPGRASLAALRPGGRLCSYGAAGGAFTRVDPEEAAAREITLVAPTRPAADQMRARTREALAHAAAGRLTPVIGQTFPLARAADAHAAIEARRTVGKTLLTV
jgi:NADPH2:quinone reductase